ncbi:hypothetical protein CHS0354_008635 [Potamilus streckersoni]|uniref:Endosome-associated-trafficking regulator 1 n=1 Tax=Potamilus streckersoni TaxID=2493646 RepID=A0AAE0THC9_9BIVA|nr:hypothetical protein CHS0354_008635 [Potamilus streckersoni]
MAEGGNENEKDNPFSFKHFVQKKDKRDERKQESNFKGSDEFDIFNYPESRSQKKKEKSRPVLLVEDDTSSKPKLKKSQNENPFSFRKFLSGDKGSSAQGSESNISSRSSSSSISKVAPDLASDLPDFVQDHLNDPSQDGRHRDLDLPDFTLPGSSNIPDVSAVIENGAVNDIGVLSPGPVKNRAVNNARHISSRQVREPGVDGDLFESDSEDERTSRTQFVVGVLPDFLSDGAIGTGVDNSPDPLSQQQIDNCAKIIQSEHTDLSGQTRENISAEELAELKRLKEENGNLRQLLQESQQKLTAESVRVAELMSEVEALKRKEAEETATMEKVIQQVEENLTTTTKRAVSAESNVAKLKQEVKTLQAQVSSLQENTVLQSADRGLTDIKERTKYVSEQLSSAASTAEMSLRYKSTKTLHPGTDQFRHLTQV